MTNETTPETPIACRSCGSPACEWPGECAEPIHVPGEERPDSERCATCDHFEEEHDPECEACAGNVAVGLLTPCLVFVAQECEACGAPLHDGKCPNCTAPLEAPEEILDILNDLIEWDAFVGPFENEVWDRARAIRDRLVVK